jgi:hypothetical protein
MHNDLPKPSVKGFGITKAFLHTITSIDLSLIIRYSLLYYLVTIARSCTRYWANIGTYRTSLLNSSTERQQTFSISKLHSL